MRTLRLAAVAALAALPAPGSAQQSALIVRPGTQLGPTPTWSTDVSWFGLYKEPSGFALRPTTVTVAEVPHPCTGSAVQIKADGPSNPLFLLSAPRLRPGPAPTAAFEPGFLHPGQTRNWQLDRLTRYWLAAFGAATPIQGNTLYTEYRIVLAQGPDGDTLQFPTRFAQDGRPTILWAGDLDGDGQLDVIADLQTHYASHRLALFLSRSALPPHRIALVAERHEPGC